MTGCQGIYPNRPSTPASPILRARPVPVPERQLTDRERRARDIALSDLLGDTDPPNRQIGAGA